jgi:hypothetical protein
VFSENIKVTATPVLDGVYAFVIDDALIDVDSLVQFAAKAKGAFKATPVDRFPGVELRMADSFSTKFEDFFRRHLKPFFDARRIVSSHTRLSLLTTPIDALTPAQCIPARGLAFASPEFTTVSACLFLFDDESLGGTSFYVPKQSARETWQLFEDADSLSMDVFSEKYGVPRSYGSEATERFQLVQDVPAKRNRLVVYDGALLSAPTVTAPDRLSDEPALGRLVLNATLVCRRHANGFANRWVR